MATGGRFRELLKKYGKVAFGVHFSVSGASIAGLYAAIKNNVDVESLLHKVGISGVSDENKDLDVGSDPVQIDSFPNKDEIDRDVSTSSDFVFDDRPGTGSPIPMQKKNRTAELAASSGGALMLALLCNKALLPIRVPITIALTPAVSRFLARRRIIKPHV